MYVQAGQPGDPVTFDFLDENGITGRALDGSTITLSEAKPSDTVLAGTHLALSVFGPASANFPDPVVLDIAKLSVEFGFGAPIPLTPCFAEGSRINTPTGPKQVEALAVGDSVSVTGGETRTIKWLGHRHVHCARHPTPWDVMPVRIRAHAFGSERPIRDLVLSPDHAIAWKGALIPIRYLINDTTIIQERVDHITYWHVECDEHVVLLAERLPVESYLDTGNRAAFSGGEATQLHPRFEIADREVWARLACLPLVESGPRLAELRHVLAARAANLGRPVPRFLPVALDRPGLTTVRIPADVSRIHLTSFCHTPRGEHRRLGVSIAGLWIDEENVSLDGEALVSGFHAVEADTHDVFRWTHGEGVLVVELAGVERGLAVLVKAVQRRSAAA
eukprot:gene5992-6063_t